MKIKAKIVSETSIYCADWNRVAAVTDRWRALVDIRVALIAWDVRVLYEQCAV